MLLRLSETDELVAHRDDLGSRVLLGRAMDLGPEHRFDPLPDLIVDWTEIVSLALSVATLTQETQSGRVMYGPFAIGNVTIQQSGTDNRNLKAAISLEDSDVESAVSNFMRAMVPHEYVSDTTDQTVGIGAATAPVHILGSRIIRRGTGRVSLIVMNQTAATIAVTMTAMIHHMRAVTPDRFP